MRGFSRLLTAILVTAASTLLLAACREQPVEEEEFEQEAFFFQNVARGYYAAFTDTTEMVIRSQDEWEEVRQMLRVRGEVRPVDFEQVILLVAAIPVEESGYEIEFNAVERDRDGLVAYYLVHEPGYDCLPAAMEGMPFQVVLVRRSEEPVRFERETVKYPCGFRRI